MKYTENLLSWERKVVNYGFACETKKKKDKEKRKWNGMKVFANKAISLEGRVKMNSKLSESGPKKKKHGTCLHNRAPSMPVFVNLLNNSIICQSGVK